MTQSATDGIGGGSSFTKTWRWVRRREWKREAGALALLSVSLCACVHVCVCMCACVHVCVCMCERVCDNLSMVARPRLRNCGTCTWPRTVCLAFVEVSAKDPSIATPESLGSNMQVAKKACERTHTHTNACGGVFLSFFQGEQMSAPARVHVPPVEPGFTTDVTVKFVAPNGTCTKTHAHTHTRTQAHMHTHAHTNTHTHRETYSIQFEK